MLKTLRRSSCAVIFVALALSGCGPQRGEFAPACPTPILERTLADVAQYRPGSNGRDLTDLVLQGRIVSVNGACKLADRKGSELLVSVQVGMQMTRGPAMQGRSADIPVFIAVTDGQTILDKQTYVVRADFPSNIEMVGLTGGPIDLKLPITLSKSGAAYQVRVGFQLTDEELEANRRRMGGS
jgi:hypothetical protein